MSIPPKSMSPDWILIGVQYEGRCAIYASRTLTQAEIEPVVDECEWLQRDVPLRYRPHVQEIEVRGRMGELVFVVGETYGEAFEYLMRHWSADRPEGPSEEIRSRPALGES